MIRPMTRVETFVDIAKDYRANYHAFKRLAKEFQGKKRDELFMRAGESRAKAKIQMRKAREAKGVA